MENPPPSGALPRSLPPGTTVGGRFQIEARVAEDELGEVYRASDSKTGKALALRHLPADLLDAPGVAQLKAECRTAAALRHAHLAATFGVGKAPDGSPFVASEWIEGRRLSEVLEVGDGAALPLSEVYRRLADVCDALSAVHARSRHGAVGPESVWMSSSGEMKVADLGWLAAVLSARGPEALPSAAHASLAPEVRAGGEADRRSDVFGVGALLYLLLSGRSPAEGFVPPSTVHAEATPGLDQVLLTCLAADPSARFPSVDAVKRAFAPFAGQDAGSPAGDGTGLDTGLDIDIDVGSAPPPAPPAAPPAPLAAPLAAPRASALDLGAVLSHITANDAPRWMLVKDGLDHGPFSGRELVDLSVANDARREHELLNMDTGRREPLGAWEEFEGFLAEAEAEAAATRRRDALAAAERSDKRSGRTKLAIAAVVLLGILGAVGAFMATRDAQEAESVAGADLGDLYARGEIELTGTGGILPDPPRGRRGSRASGAPAIMGGFAGSYEQAMAIPVELGDATMNGGQRRLSAGDVSGVMNRNLNRLFSRCVAPARGRGERPGQVTVDIAIAGSGQVMGVSARHGSGAFKACVRSAVRGVRFPTFGAPRMGARYSFDANQ
ncbi:MAG: protein kinase [Myxococcota bacterium]